MRTALALVILLLAACGEPAIETVTPPPPTEQELAWQKLSHDPERIARGRELYLENQAANCWNCHGKDGLGHEQLKVPSLLDDRWVYGSRMEDLFHTIKHGRGNGRMPGIHEHFDDEAILDLAIFIADWNRRHKVTDQGSHSPGEKHYPIDY